jgi:hypothetical protein
MIMPGAAARARVGTAKPVISRAEMNATFIQKDERRTMDFITNMVYLVDVNTDESTKSQGNRLYKARHNDKTWSIFIHPKYDPSSPTISLHLHRSNRNASVSLRRFV